MKEDAAPESIRAEAVLPLISKLISKQVDCGGRAVYEDAESVMAPVELELGIILVKGSGVSRELELSVEKGKSFKTTWGKEREHELG